MPLFGRKPAKRGVEPLPRLELKLIEDAAEFDGRDGAVEVHGFDVEYPSGEALCLSDDSPVDKHVYYFRVAGLMHHQAAAQSENFAPTSQVFLLREPTNPHDPNAIQVLGQAREMIGYVPAEAAASMAAIMTLQGMTVALGAVTKVFKAHGKRNAVEILAGINRDIGLSGTVDDGDGKELGGDDLWRLK